MVDKANITSLQALERFRSALISYVEKAKATVDEVSSEVQRTKFWLHYDQTTHWKNEYKRRSLKWQEKQQELFSAEISQFSESSTVQRWAVEEAKRAMDEAVEKVRLVKEWTRRYESAVMPAAKPVDKLGSLLDSDMTNAIRFLTEAVKALNEYAEIGMPVADAARRRQKEDGSPGAEADADAGGAAAEGDSV